MGFELGVLLGQYDQAQSFENVSSWENDIKFAVTSLQTSHIHSSFLGFQTNINSGAVGSLYYNYDAPNDYQLRRYTDTSTHRIVTYGWARVSDAVGSGAIIVNMFTDGFILDHGIFGLLDKDYNPLDGSSGGVTGGTGATPIPFSANLQRFRNEFSATNSDTIHIKFTVQSVTSGFIFYLDDVTTALDVIDLMPEWDSEEDEIQSLQSHQTLGGRNSFYSWGQQQTWKMNLRYVPSSEAQTINDWWENRYNLLFCFNTSETNQTYITRLSNEIAPMTQLEQPYSNLYRGTLLLDLIKTSLDF